MWFPVNSILAEFFCRIRVNKGCPTDHHIHFHLRNIRAEHLCFSYADLVDVHGWLEQGNEIMFEFITCQELEIIACGVQIMTEESKRRRMIEFDEASKASQDSRDSELRDRLICDSKENGKAETHTGCWSWILLSLDLEKHCKLILGKKTIDSSWKPTIAISLESWLVLFFET